MVAWESHKCFAFLLQYYYENDFIRELESRIFESVYGRSSRKLKQNSDTS